MKSKQERGESENNSEGARSENKARMKADPSVSSKNFGGVYMYNGSVHPNVCHIELGVMVSALLKDKMPAQTSTSPDTLLKAGGVLIRVGMVVATSLTGILAKAPAPHHPGAVMAQKEAQIKIAAWEQFYAPFNGKIMRAKSDAITLDDINENKRATGLQLSSGGFPNKDTLLNVWIVSTQEPDAIKESSVLDSSQAYLCFSNKDALDLVKYFFKQKVLTFSPLQLTEETTQEQLSECIKLVQMLEVALVSREANKLAPELNREIEGILLHTKEVENELTVLKNNFINSDKKREAMIKSNEALSVLTNDLRHYKTQHYIDSMAAHTPALTSVSYHVIDALKDIAELSTQMTYPKSITAALPQANQDEEIESCQRMGL